MRALKWLAVNGGYAALVWFAVNGSEPARNLVLFFTPCVFGFAALACVGALLMEPEEAAKLTRKARSVPRWFDVSADVAITGVLVAYGWFFTGFLWLSHMLFLSTAIIWARDKAKEATR